MRLSIVGVWCALQAAAFAPAPMLVQEQARRWHTRAPAKMILPKGPSKGNPDATPEQVRRTLVRTGFVWAGIGSILALATSSGKTFSRENAPGYAEAAAKKEAASKAYLAEKEARAQAIAARAAADKAAGRPQTAPPKPWEKGLEY